MHITKYRNNGEKGDENSHMKEGELPTFLVITEIWV